MAALGTVGIADKGVYNPTETYKKGNFVLHNDSTWLVLANEITGVTPIDDGVNWKYLAKGASTLIDTEGLLGTTGASVSIQALTDELSDRVATKLLPIANVVNTTTTTVAGKALDARQANPNETNSLAYKIKNHLMINVKDFGAVGDGVADDTNAIKAAIAYIPNGGCIWIPNGTYVVTDTITLDNIQLKLDSYGVIKMNANKNVIEMMPYSSITGGVIDVTDTVFESAAIYFNGLNKFGLVETPFNCYVNNLTIKGAYKGVGIDLYAPAGEGGSADKMSFVEHIWVDNVNIFMTEVGIKLHKETSNTNWVNGNTFSNFLIEGTKYAITIGEGCEGNVFTNFQYQPYANNYSLNFAIVSGNLNYFNGFVWDWFFEGQNEAIYVNGSMNTFITNLDLYRHNIFADLGTNNYFKNNVQGYYNDISYPHSEGNNSFIGDQDDNLFAIKKWGGVTTSITPTSGVVAAMFLRDGACAFSGTVEIIIDLTNKPIISLERVGIEFINNNHAKTISIEAFYDGNYHGLINTQNGNDLRDFFFYNRPTNVTALRISLISDSPITVGRIYAKDSNTKGNAFIEDYGTTYHGDLTFNTSGDGVILIDNTNNSRWKLYVSNGVLAIKPW